VAFVGLVQRWCVALLCQAGYHLTTQKLAQGTEYHTCLSLVSRSMVQWNAAEQVRARAEEPARAHEEAQAKVHGEVQVKVHVEGQARVHEAFLRTGA
jgi:hypothetical protein